jgi:hypothetical protein
MAPQLQRVAREYCIPVMSGGGFDSVTDKHIKAFTRELGGGVTFTRLAVTREQIAQYDLPTAPPKATDKRAFRGQTCQAEALAPDVLAGILRHAIEQRIGHRVLDRVLKRERAERRKLVRLLGVRP